MRINGADPELFNKLSLMSVGVGHSRLGAMTMAKLAAVILL